MLVSHKTVVVRQSPNYYVTVSGKVLLFGLLSNGARPQVVDRGQIEALSKVMTLSWNRSCLDDCQDS